MYSISKIEPENGGYSYTINGPVPCKCWSRLKPDLKKIEKSLQRLNQAQTRGFNNSKKSEAKK